MKVAIYLFGCLFLTVYCEAGKLSYMTNEQIRRVNSAMTRDQLDFRTEVEFHANSTEVGLKVTLQAAFGTVQYKAARKVVIVSIGRIGAVLLESIKRMLCKQYDGFKVVFVLDYDSNVVPNEEYENCVRLLRDLKKKIEVYRYENNEFSTDESKKHDQLYKETYEKIEDDNFITISHENVVKELTEAGAVVEGIFGSEIHSYLPILKEMQITVNLIKAISEAQVANPDLKIICTDGVSGANEDGIFEAGILPYKVTAVMFMEWGRAIVNSNFLQHSNIYLLWSAYNMSGGTDGGQAKETSFFDYALDFVRDNPSRFPDTENRDLLLKDLAEAQRVQSWSNCYELYRNIPRCVQAVA